MTLQEEIKKKIGETIYEWVKQNFGESEADDPSWNIEALAEELSKSSLIHDIYRAIELDYLKEDVEYYAEQHNYKLTEQQKYAVADKIMNSEWYCSIDPEDLYYYVNEELKRGK